MSLVVVPTEPHFDYAVVGSGFAGSIMAMVLRRLGASVLLLERGSHPRFAIGESSTPLANLVLEILAKRYDLPFLKELSEWGSWQRHHPDLGVGLKRGFTFYHHRPGEEMDFGDRSRQLLVAASPNDEVADTHWYRPDLDLFLVERARSMGVDYRDRFQMDRADYSQGQWKLCGGGARYSAEFLIDASGGNGGMSRQLGIEEGAFPGMPETEAVYAHFREVGPTCEARAGMPYPPGDAAVHHLFDQGWMWVLRFRNGITSAGIARRKSKGPAVPPEVIWNEALEMFPTLGEAFAPARRVTPFFTAPRIWFRRTRAIGPGFALLPSAAAFVDPLLSSGFALLLLGIERLGEIVAAGSGDFGAYEEQTFREADAVADLVSALYAKMHSFPEFAQLTLLYFAALSFTETCWRLDKRAMAPEFLLANDSAFSAARGRLCATARAGETISREEVAAAIAPIDIAGLTHPNRGNWHPVETKDLMDAREKIQATRADVAQLFRSLGISLGAHDKKLRN